MKEITYLLQQCDIQGEILREIKNFPTSTSVREHFLSQPLRDSIVYRGFVGEDTGKYLHIPLEKIFPLNAKGINCLGDSKEFILGYKASWEAHHWEVGKDSPILDMHTPSKNMWDLGWNYLLKQTFCSKFLTTNIRQWNARGLKW